MRLASGVLLVATPGLIEPSFARSVVFLMEYSPKGSLGFIINRPLPTPLGKIWSDVPAGLADAVAAAEGGPVERSQGLLLHASPTLTGAQEMALGCAVGGDLEALAERYAAGCDATGPRLFLGHSAWTGGQLEREIEEGAWLLRQGERHQLLDNQPETELWRQLVEDRTGGMPQPSLN